MPMNFAKTAVLLGLLTAIFVSLGGFVGGQTGLVVALLIAIAMNVAALWKSDQMVLRMQNAQEVSAQSGGQLYVIVEELARRAELPMPRVCVMQNPQPNAFATGRSPARAAVCASTGLLEMLSAEEVAGVMAHELAHVKNRDTLTMTVAATLGGAISMLTQWMQLSAIFGHRSSGNRHGRLATFVAMLLAPLAAMIVQMAVSRSREYQADRLGGMMCGNPLWLASALERIQEAVRGIRNPTAEQMPASAHLFIINPLTGRGFDNFFMTHPNTENRVSELRKLAVEMGINSEMQQPATTGGQGRFLPSRTQPRGTWG